MSGAMHAWAEQYFMVPFASTGADWLAYVAEGDVGNTTLFSALMIIEVFTGGGLTGVNTVGKISLKVGLGSGVRKLSTEAGMGGKVTNTIKTKRGYTITFKHGDRHAKEIGSTPEVIETAIAEDIDRIGKDNLGDPGIKHTTNVNGVDVEYGTYLEEDGNINVGTYYKKKGEN